MNDNVIQLLQDAANLFASLACEIEKDQRDVRNRLDALNSEVHKNKSTLKAVAKTILDNLD